MKIFCDLFLGACLHCLVFASTSVQALNLQTEHLSLVVPVKNWEQLRYEGVIKQKFDFSCSAASIATLLNGYYGKNITEEDVLKQMNIQGSKASFDDMARVLDSFGFYGIGVALSFEQLTQLKIPAIIFTKHRKTEHFSVITGVNDKYIRVADPSLGNVHYAKNQFLQMWETRQHELLKGKVLIILPKKNSPQAIVHASFFKTKVHAPAKSALQSVQSEVFRR